MMLRLLVGATVGALLLLLEVLLTATVDGTWSSLLTAPMVGWALGAVAGGLAALLVGGGRPGRVLPRVLFLLLTGQLLVQLNHRLLPDALAPLSLLVTVLLLGFLLFLFRLAAPTLERWGAAASPSRLAMGLAFSGAVALGLTLWAPQSQGVVRPWAPSLAPWPVPEGPEAGRRALLVVGIDGGRWDTIDPLLAAGRLPNLAGLVARGRRGVLASSVRSASPVVWTTITTGRPPEDHGITDWDVAISTNRRVRPIWSVLGELGFTSFVVNVPGSYPADSFPGGMLAGFPMPQGSRSNRGWLATNVGPVHPYGPAEVSLAGIGSGPRHVALKDLPSPFALEKTTPYLIVRRISEPLALAMAHRVSAREYASLEISVEQREGLPHLIGMEAGEELFALTEGEWGEWLAVDVDGQSCIFCAHAVRVQPGETSLLFTPFFRDDAAGLSSPPGLAGALQRAGRPYVAEGTGWQVFYEPRVLGSLEEHLTDIAADRAGLAGDLLERAPWDAFFHIFTLTDRIQHPFWKYREPEFYARLPELYPDYTRPDDYAAHQPNAADVRDFGPAIDRAYERVDRWLGKLLESVTDSTLIVVVSDHGGQGGPHELSPTAGIHHEDGIYLVAGPTVPATDSAKLEVPLQLIDIVPLILAHLQLPGARDLPGSIPPSLMPHDLGGGLVALPEPVETYEIGTHTTTGGEIDGSIRDQLRSLGYVK